MPGRGLVPDAQARVVAMAGGVMCASTDRRDGDFAASDPVVLAGLQQRIVARRWSAPGQVHGAGVVEVRQPGDGCGVEADALVSTRDDVALAVVTADCAPVAFASREGAFGVAHAGWRGLVAGVLEATVQALRHLGARQVHAVVGPCIHAECYEFAAPDLDAAVAAAGGALRGADRHGRPALDLPGGVAAVLQRAGVVVDEVSPVCTACSAAHWSWRGAGDRARQATVAWRRAGATP